jgi:hypothetical protein
MTLRFVALALMMFEIVVASVGGASAQVYSPAEEVPRHKKCTSWPLEPGADRRWIFPYEIAADGIFERRGKGLISADKSGGYQERPGRFVAKARMTIGIVSSPSNVEMGADFILLEGAAIEFYPEDPPSTVPILLRRGHFDFFRKRGIDKEQPGIFGIECIRGRSAEHFEEVPRPGGGSLFGEKSASSGSESLPPDGLGGLSVDPPKPLASIPPGSISETFDKDSKANLGAPGGIAGAFSSKPEPRPGASAPAATSKLGDLSSLATPLELPSKEPTGSGLKDIVVPTGKDVPRSSGSICEIQTGSPVLVPKDVRLASLQAVGVRNENASASGFDYIMSGDALPLGRTFDVADSVKKLVPYETVPVLRGVASEKLFVAIPGVDEAQGKRPEAVAAKPAKALRIIVVSGAAELAMSGLDLVDAPFRGPGSDQIGLDIEWQIIDPTGSLRAAGQYSTFSALVKAAADKVVERPDVLNEAELSTLFDDFENALKTRTVDKVFWIKGAYAIPSSIPQRFERFLAAVSSSSAIPHAPSGRPGKWLQIVTARMPGFSVAYLKEPVNLLQIGDVVEEGDGAGGGSSRRLITATEANVLATRLRTGLTSSPVKPGLVASPDRGGLAGKLVFDANEVFFDRGYILSADAALVLQVHLQQVLRLWDAGRVRTDVLAEFAGKIAKSRPTMMDILQMADEKAYPRLPPNAPDWLRKPVKDLNQAESDMAKAYAAAYLAGVDRLVDKTRKPVANCSLYYVSEGYLGFRKP